MAGKAFWLALLLGVAMPFGALAVEGLLKPRPRLRRPWSAWAAHCGVSLALYALVLLLTGRPLCAAAGTLAVLVMLVLVNNAKVHHLREPFLFQDYEYFLDTLREPRLFLPFLGLRGFLLAALGFLFALLCLALESPPPARWSLAGQGACLVLLMLVAGGCLGLAARLRCPVRFAPAVDQRRLGFLTPLWLYALASGQRPDPASPFEHPRQKKRRGRPPHLVAVQSESFFDARQLYAGVHPDVLRHFDELRQTAVRWGRLRVPAWGANTVRSEFAFLTGIAGRELGARRFNPYTLVRADDCPPALPLYLKNMGYDTLCIHPFAARFYRRDRVFAAWGFDRFWDIRHFAQAHHYGPYVTDIAVARAILEALRTAERPLFIFAITMENHGPLALEPIRLKDMRDLYQTPPMSWHRDLTRYLRHLRHADYMAGALAKAFAQAAVPTSLCWYGDHVPILPEVYAHALHTVADTDYLIWRNPADRVMLALGAPPKALAPKKLEISELALHWLHAEGLW